MLIGSYKLIKEKGRIGSWLFCVGENANGRCLLKVSPRLPVEGGYRGLRPYIERVKERAEQAALVNVPAEIKYKDCTYDPKTNRIVIAYRGNHRKMTVLDYLGDVKPPDMQKSLWHLGVQMAHAKGWDGLGLADVFVDQRGCWWPDPLGLRHVFAKFGFSSGYSLGECEVENGLDILHKDWTEFTGIIDQFLAPSDGVIGVTTSNKFSGDLTFIYKLNRAMRKCDDRFNERQQNYRAEVSQLLSDRDGDFQLLNKPIELPDIDSVPFQGFGLVNLPLVHEWFNGYFWEPVYVEAGSHLLHISPMDPNDHRTSDVRSYINVVTITGLVLLEYGPFRNRESDESEVLFTYDESGSRLVLGSKLKLKNGLLATVVKVYENGKISVQFDQQTIDKSEIIT